MSEFPVYQWLHKDQQSKIQSDEHEMKLNVLGRTSSLGDLTLTCTCGVDDRNLEGAIGAGFARRIRQVPWPASLAWA